MLIAMPWVASAPMKAAPVNCEAWSVLNDVRRRTLSLMVYCRCAWRTSRLRVVKATTRLQAALSARRQSEHIRSLAEGRPVAWRPSFVCLDDRSGLDCTEGYSSFVIALRAANASRPKAIFREFQ